MKYYLYSADRKINKKWNGVYAAKSDDIDILTVLLSEIGPYTRNETVQLDTDCLKNITPIYDKICKLAHITMNDADSFDYSFIAPIKKSFEKGKYPTKSEFKAMNKMWNKLK